MALGFVAAYVALDRISYIEPLFGLDITPWNPPAALGLVYWLKRGRAAAPIWFAAILLSEALTRHLQEGLPLTILFSAGLTFGYGLMGSTLGRYFTDSEIFGSRRRLFIWINIVAIGTLLNSLGYISILYVAGAIPPQSWLKALTKFWIGDAAGIAVSMPIMWLLASLQGRERLKSALAQWETAGYALLATGLIWTVFSFLDTVTFNHLYFLFLPVIWAAARQGLTGAIIAACVLQIGIVAGVEWRGDFAGSIAEFQLLGAMLALVGFFIGVVVDEERQATEDLKRTSRLAAAGDMATALAHELNQPVTALLAYGKACEYLLDRGEMGEPLKAAIRHMVAESTRAAEVVRRLRDFFRTGALKLESAQLESLVADVVARLSVNFREHAAELRVDVPPTLPMYLDRLQIELVLRNLLSNALDSVAALPEAQRRVRLSARLLNARRVRISVEDEGPGLSAEVAARLFEPFVSTKSSGLGLGLVISKAIVEAHGGTLWAETRGRGLFLFELPIER